MNLLKITICNIYYYIVLSLTALFVLLKNISVILVLELIFQLFSGKAILEIEIMLFLAFVGAINVSIREIFDFAKYLKPITLSLFGFNKKEEIKIEDKKDE